MLEILRVGEELKPKVPIYLNGHTFPRSVFKMSIESRQSYRMQTTSGIEGYSGCTALNPVFLTLLLRSNYCSPTERHYCDGDLLKPRRQLRDTDRTDMLCCSIRSSISKSTSSSPLTQREHRATLGPVHSVQFELITFRNHHLGYRFLLLILH